MIVNYKKMNVLNSIILCVILIIISFSTDNPLVLFGVFLLCIVIHITSGNREKVKKATYHFIPFAIATIVINMLFVSEGRTPLFYILGKRFTLESLIYATILSLKLLQVIYIFMLLDVTVDSDRAVSYFSSKLPKATLMMMIGIKFFPDMKEKLLNLKYIYAVRGVDFESKKIKDRIKSYIPILSILLQSSLEGGFDIGEAVYVKGFLSHKRSIYDRQVYKKNDYIFLVEIVIFIVTYSVFRAKGKLNFDVYSDMILSNIINKEVLILNILTCIIIFTMMILFKNEKRME